MIYNSPSIDIKSPINSTQGVLLQMTSKQGINSDSMFGTTIPKNIQTGSYTTGDFVNIPLGHGVSKSSMIRTSMFPIPKSVVSKGNS
jgi:hypothetical protein